tara:strand:+ start:77 stop:574 length:498 start_codon:yes stop_codon:yes gene_type:complete
MLYSNLLTDSSIYPLIEAPLVNVLHKDGKRLTPQRQKILALFQEIGTGIHLSAEDVHQKLVVSNSRVSLATVYRTLRLLVEMGFLHELELREGGHRFELTSHEHPDHHHLVCIRCGRTEEFESDQVLKAGRLAAKRIGFVLIESTQAWRALCPACQLDSNKKINK